MKTKRRTVAYSYSENKEFWLLTAPLLILLAIFIVGPVCMNFYYAFTKWKGFGEPTWVGLRNFRRMMRDRMFWAALKNLGILSLYIPLRTMAPLLIAAVLREGLRGWQIFRSLLYLPHVVGAVLISILFSIFLADTGPLNALLTWIGLGAVPWLSHSKVAIHTLGGLLGVWWEVGFGCIYFLAAMSTIDPDLFDAANIDGAGWWRTLFSVTIPSVTYAVQFWLVKSFITVFARMWGPIFLLTKGGPGYSTVTLEYGIYVKGFSDYRMGYASSWALVLFGFCAIIALVQIYVIRRQQV